MELPIIVKFDETYNSEKNTHLERIRIIDVDGISMVSVLTTHKSTKEVIEINELAFTTVGEAHDYMRMDLKIEPPEDDEYEWSDYE